MTYQEAYRQAQDELKNADIGDAATDAWILMEHITGMSRAIFLADGYREIPEEIFERYKNLIDKRKQKIPVQHLTGTQEFMGLEFQVNEHVLIPRQDTEILVEETEKCLKPGMHVLDMCTGSGCIAISLAVRNKGIQCMGADISAKALETAKLNAMRHDAEVSFVKTDMFSNIKDKFDVIVSNPPYIPTKVIQELQEEVRLHDPYDALDGKEDGLYFYRILAEECKEHLRDGGCVAFEIGHDQSKAVEKLLAEAGLEQIRTQKDLAGLDRVVLGVYNVPSL